MIGLMELKITGLSMMGVVKTIEVFGDRITDIRTEHNLKNDKLEFSITLGGAEEFLITPEKNRIEIVDCKDFKELKLYTFQFQKFIIQ